MHYREIYEQWQKDFAGDPEAIKELLSIADHEAEIEDRFYTELSFGTAGLRGVLGMGTNRMNRYVVRRTTWGLADYMKTINGAAERGVVVAFDSRNMSDEFAREAALILAAQGVRAFLFPTLRPVPVLSFSIRQLGCAAGIIITASHNPPQYNGYKVYWEDGAQMPPERADAVTAFIRACPYSQCVPMAEDEAIAKGLLVPVTPEVDDAYIERVKTLCVQPELLRVHGHALKIVYTPLHGAGNVPVRRVLREVGITNLLVVPEQEKPDGNFPTVCVPNPEEPDTFTLAIALANREQADACFATDPDCDRLGVATRDPSGAFVLLTGNQIGCLLLHYILSSRKEMGTLPADGFVVKSIVSTELARAITNAYGIKLVEVLTGFKFIAEQIEEHERTGSGTFLFGFEEAYGYLSSTFVRDKDAVNASLLVTELTLSLKRQGKTLYDRLQEIYQTYGYAVEQTKSVAYQGKDGAGRMREIMKQLRGNPPAAIAGLKVLAVRDYENGLRTDAEGATALGMVHSNVLYYELQDGCWLCVRPSGTEPKIKLYIGAYAKTQQAANALAARLAEDSQGFLQ